MKKRTEKGSIGQSFDEFLKEEGRFEESTNQAVKRVIAYQLTAAMENQQMSKSALARKLHTSRAQLDRLLDPENTRVTLDALVRAAHAVGRRLQLELR
jgi:antitoxin HicB